GQVVAPPSLHHSGQRYAWDDAAAHTPLADAPDWLIKLLSSSNGDRHHQTVSLPEGAKIPEGRRNSSLARLAGRLRSQGMGLSEISAALLSLNQARCQPPLEKSEVLAIAKSMARYTPNRIPTDDELADHWLEAHPDTAYGRMTFMRYRDGLWDELPSSQVEHEILAVIEEAKESGYKPSYWKLHSIMELGRVMVTIPDVQWDADAELLVCRNGTLHIPSRSLREHSPQDHITSGLDFDYNPQAEAVTWRYFLNDTVPGAQEFLQEFAGYALTTDTRHEIAVWLYGAPGSGKSTFLAGLLAMLGAKAGLLGLADIERSRFALTALPGKTLMVSSEQPASYITTSHIINSLISGEPLTVERKYKEAFTMVPMTKIIWAMNETPRIAGGADGLFRRVKVVQFPKLKCPPNPALKEIIKGEGAGILNWALDGLEHLKARDHFDIPPCIVNATQEFQKKNDIPAMFVTENCEVHPGNAVKSSLLYERYKQWCFDNGLKARSIVTLAEDWQRLGFSRVRRRDGCFYWEGVRLIDTFLMKDNEGYK
ncbi:MAG: phage/plasmid primase, P4 family, partial [Chloroflexota bacterium]